jgi:hypothetical protein
MHKIDCICDKIDDGYLLLLLQCWFVKNASFCKFL